MTSCCIHSRLDFRMPLYMYLAVYPRGAIRVRIFGLIPVRVKSEKDILLVVLLLLLFFKSNMNGLNKNWCPRVLG